MGDAPSPTTCVLPQWPTGAPLQRVPPRGTSMVPWHMIDSVNGSGHGSVNSCCPRISVVEGPASKFCWGEMATFRNAPVPNPHFPCTMSACPSVGPGSTLRPCQRQCTAFAQHSLVPLVPNGAHIHHPKCQARPQLQRRHVQQQLLAHLQGSVGSGPARVAARHVGVERGDNDVPADVIDDTSSVGDGGVHDRDEAVVRAVDGGLGCRSAGDSGADDGRSLGTGD